MMACMEGKTNRECYFFGMGWWGLWDGRKQKEGFAEKELRLLQTGQYRVRRPVGELPFWVFSVAIR